MTTMELLVLQLVGHLIIAFYVLSFFSAILVSDFVNGKWNTNVLVIVVRIYICGNVLAKIALLP